MLRNTLHGILHAYLVFSPHSVEFLFSHVNIVKWISIRRAVPNYTVHLVIHSVDLIISNDYITILCVRFLSMHSELPPSVY